MDAIKDFDSWMEWLEAQHPVCKHTEQVLELGRTATIEQVDEQTSIFRKMYPEESAEYINTLCRHWALEGAVAGNNSGLCAILIANTDDVTPNRIRAATRAGSLDVLDVFIEKGWDINAPDTFLHPPHLGYAAAETAGNATLKWFLANGADPNAGNEYVTAFSYAVSSAPMENLELLVQHGADVTKGGPLCWLTQWAKQDMGERIEYLLKLGASLETQTRWTEMFGVERQGTVPPLQIAIRHTNCYAVRTLLAAGANPYTRTMAGRTAFEVPEAQTNAEIRNMLLEWRERKDKSTEDRPAIRSKSSL